MNLRLLCVVIVAALTFGCSGPEPESPDTADDAGSPLPETQSGTADEPQETATVIGEAGSVLAAPGTLGPSVGMPREVWRFNAGSPSSASPIVVGDTVVVGFADYTVCGISAASGALIWARPVSDIPVSLAGIESGVIVAGATSVSRLASEDGSVEWTVSAEVAPGVAPGARIRATPRAVYVPTSEGQLIALALETGARLWISDPDTRSEAAIVGTVAALDGVLYVCSSDGGLSAVTASSGEVRWTTVVAAGFATGPVVTGEGSVAVGVDGRVVAFDLSTGAWKHTARVDQPVIVNAINSERALSVFGVGGGLYVFGPDVWTGSPVASLRGVSDEVTREVLGLGSDLAGQPALLDHLILAADAAGRLHGLDAHGGTQKWVSELHTRIIGEFAFDGTAVFASGADGSVLGLVFDVALDSVPVFSGDRVWDLPDDGRFRMESRVVELVYVAGDARTVEWVFSSTVADDELIVTILDAAGNALSTNMGKVVLAQTARATLQEPGEYRVRLERLYPNAEAVLTLSSEVVE